MNEIIQRLDRIEKYSIIAAKSVLTIKEAAFILGVTEQTVRKKVRNKEIPSYKPDANKLYFKKSELEDWMLSNRVMTKAEVTSKASAYCLTHINKLSI